MAIAVADYGPPWTLSREEDRRFYRILGLCLLASLLFAVVAPRIPLPVEELAAGDDLPPRRVRLLDEPPAPEPRKVPVAPAAVTPDPMPRPEPPRAGRSEPAAIAETGVLAMRGALDALRNRVPGAGTARGQIDSGAATAPPQASLLGQGLIQIGGSVEAGVTHESVLGSTDLPRPSGGGGAPVAGGGAGAPVRSASSGPTRTEEEIQEVLDRHKGAMYALYNRALRIDPDLQGKLLLRITILPSGAVERSEILESSLEAESLERALAALVRGIDFGERAGVPVVTTRIPIEFFPQ
jgi:outer membrane biosynthesis protein TonB